MPPDKKSEAVICYFCGREITFPNYGVADEMIDGKLRSVRVHLDACGDEPDPRAVGAVEPQA